MREFIETQPVLAFWIGVLIAGSFVGAIITGYFRARKIQPRGFKLKQFGFEGMVAVISVAISGPIIGGLTAWWTNIGWIEVSNEPAAWWMIALEYGAYFVLFDTWFYWLHRWMHKEPVYTWVHKLHHHSTAPNLLTTLSVNPLESLVNGGFVPLFLAAYSVHPETLALIGPTNIVMGFYVHSGYEFLPRWWNRSWATKWFITATFHDQHHKYFTCNFGGYTTVWDRICGTVRPKFESDFENPKARQPAKVAAAAASEPAAA